MKRFCFFYFFFFCILPNVSGQENSVEMNDRAFSNFSNNSYNTKSPFHSHYNDKLIYIKEQSLYNNLNDKKLQVLLLNSRNSEIIHLVKKAKKNRKREFIGFAAIPLGVAAAACIRSNNINPSLLKPLGITFLTASVSCIVISPVANYRKNANYKEAVKMYNLRF